MKPAVYSSGVLWTGGFAFWMKNLTRGRMFPYTWTGCKIGKPLFHFCSQYSSVLLVAMTIEKCIALYFPLKTKSICTVKTAKIVSFIAGSLLLGFNLQFVFLYTTHKDSNGYKCCDWVRVSDNYIDVYYEIDTFLYSFIPLSIMFTTNCLIIVKFVAAKWKNRHAGTESVNQALSKSAVRSTVMLLTVSFSFLILTLPICVYSLISQSVNPPYLFYDVSVILQYLNHGINGLLYSISGSRFRAEVFNLCKCAEVKRGGSGSGVMISNTRLSTSTVSRF